MSLRRSCGVLLHPTSLPGRFGIGDLGDPAYRFVDFLVGAGQSLWQVLPLSPTGYGDSPYQAFSAFAGNHLLISLEALVDEGSLSPEDIASPPAFPEDRVDYGKVMHYKNELLRKAARHLLEGGREDIQSAFYRFCEENAGWLDDYALFMALKESHGGAPWAEWEPELVRREPEALERWTSELAEPIRQHKFMQFEFRRQWERVKRYANERDIAIIGDIPIFVAHDSVDVWANEELFYLDEDGQPTAVAGVPPDYFSATGQLWGNPLYRWDAMAKDGYAWWIERFRAILGLVDYIRVDHFRGFEAYWRIPAGEKTAVKGKWVKGPGAALFNAVKEALGVLPILAEDLGVITPPVVALRDRFGFPGMKILQFAFASDASNKDLPHNYGRNFVVYTGTHDNDTTVGWYTGSSEPHERDYARRYMAVDGHDIAWDMIRLALASVADFAIYPAQDLLSLGTEARMNFPSRPEGNWGWRLTPGALDDFIRDRLGGLADIYGRRHVEEEDAT